MNFEATEDSPEHNILVFLLSAKSQNFQRVPGNCATTWASLGVPGVRLLQCMELPGPGYQ